AVHVLREKPLAQLAQPRLEALVHAMPDGVEETAFPARLPQPRHHRALAGSAGDQFAHVNDRNVRKVVQPAHETILSQEERLEKPLPSLPSKEASNVCKALTSAGLTR